MAISPGGRPADDSSLDRSPRSNWVEKVGGLPKYVRMVANALVRKGMAREKAIPTAINTMRKWAAGGGEVSPKVQAAAAAALAEWDAKKAATASLAAPAGRVDVGELLDLAIPAPTLEWALDALDLSDDDHDAVVLDLGPVVVSSSSSESAFVVHKDGTGTWPGLDPNVIDLAPGDYRPPYDWKHGFIPLTPAAALSKAKKAPYAGKGRAKPPKGSKIVKQTKAAKQLERNAAAARLGKARDDEQRGRAVPGEKTAAQNAVNASGPKVAKATQTGQDGATGRAAIGDTPKVDPKATPKADGFPDGTRVAYNGRESDGTGVVTGRRELDGETILAVKDDKDGKTYEWAPEQVKPRGSAPSSMPASTTPARPSSTSTNPDAPIRIEHGPDGTLVHGTSREDAAAIKAVGGFKWSRNLNAWYLPRTWGENTRSRRVDQLAEKLGDKAGVDRTTGPRKSAAERDAETRERAAGRAERMESRAERQSAEADRRFEASDLREEKSGIPFGQPILVGHHSERRHRRAIERAQANLGKGVEAQREAERAQEAAERARRTASGEESKTTTGNRIKKLEAEQRDIQRKLDGTSSQMRGPATGAYAERLRTRAAEVADDLAFNRGKLEAAGGVPSRDSVAPGDFVKVAGTWYPVQKSNAKSATVPSPMGTGTRTAPWHKVQEVRKADEVTREEVARMVADVARPFPGLADALRKAAPPKRDDDDGPVPVRYDRTLTPDAARDLSGPELDRLAAKVGTSAQDQAVIRAEKARRAGRSAGSSDSGQTPMADELARRRAVRASSGATDGGAPKRLSLNRVQMDGVEFERNDDGDWMAKGMGNRKVTEPAIKEKLDSAAPAAAAPTRGTGRFMSPATAGGITADTARRMSDEQLERALARLMADNNYDGPAFGIVSAELDRRDAARAEGNRPRR